MLIFAVAPPPGMATDGGEFSGMAESLGAEPKDVAKTVSDDVKKRPGGACRSGRGSLKKSPIIYADSSEAARAWDEAIRHIIGRHEYAVEESYINLQEREMWYSVALPEGGDVEIKEMELLFGHESGEIVSASVRVELDEAGLREVLEKIGGELDSAMQGCDGMDFDHDYHDGILLFVIDVRAGSYFQLPSFDELHDLVKKIKGIARAHEARG